VQSYYGLDKIAEVCKRVRSLDPISLAFICAITQTNKEDYRCYQQHSICESECIRNPNDPELTLE
jgi:hypothetical protein